MLTRLDSCDLDYFLLNQTVTSNSPHPEILHTVLPNHMRRSIVDKFSMDVGMSLRDIFFVSKGCDSDCISYESLVFVHAIPSFSTLAKFPPAFITVIDRPQTVRHSSAQCAAGVDLYQLCNHIHYQHFGGSKPFVSLDYWRPRPEPL